MNNLKWYLKRNGWLLVAFSSLFFLIWSPWFFSIVPKIDSEVLINTPYSKYNWLEIGRQGAILTKYLFNLIWFNPNVETLFGYLLLAIAGILFGYLFWCVGAKNKVICSAFGLLYFTAPIMTEQFYFELQIFELGWGYLLCIVAVWSCVSGFLKHKWTLLLVSMISMIWSFSTYQSFVSIYIATVISAFILLWQNETEYEEEIGWIFVWKLIGLFLLAFILNSVITRLWFFGSGDYLTSQILWSTNSISKCIWSVLRAIKHSVVGGNLFFTPLYAILSVVTVVMAVINIRCKAKRKAKLLYLLAVSLLQTTPFWMTILFGAAPALRTQLTYPLVLVCDLLILEETLHKSKKLRILPVLLAVVLGWSQISVTQRLIYTDEIRVQEDLRVAVSIQQKLLELSNPNKPVAFVGKYENRLNNSCLRGEFIGLSLFNVCSEVEPYYLWSSQRATQVLQGIGFSFLPISFEQMEEARREAVDLPIFPAEGSIVDMGNYIIVKLGNL